MVWQHTLPHQRGVAGGYRMGPSREYVIGSALVNQYMRVSILLYKYKPKWVAAKKQNSK